MKVLFATTNPSKVKYYAERLKEEGIELITLKDINLELNVEENGDNPIENAIIKAKAYYNETRIITIAVDDGLYIDGLPNDKQPKNEVRRVNGKRLDDNEMIEYYTSIVKSLGGIANVKWVKGVAIYNENDIKTFESQSNRVFVSTRSNVISEGYPLDSITYWDELNKYTSELTKEEKDSISNSGTTEIINFMISTIKEMEGISC